MLGGLRLRYYTKVLGAKAAQVFIAFERASERVRNGSARAKSVLEWLQTMAEEDRTEALSMIERWDDLSRIREESVLLISKKHCLKSKVDHHRGRLDSLEFTEATCNELEMALRDCETELTNVTAAFEEMKARVCTEENELGMLLAKYIALYGWPKPPFQRL